MSKIFPADELDDLNSNESSSINSDNDEQKKISQNNTTSDELKTGLFANQNEIKAKVLKEVMDSVLPDAGAYDTNGMVKSRATSEGGYFTKVLKQLGILEIDLHESVLGGSLNQVQKTIKRIITGKKANPSLINQYDEQGRTPLSMAVKAKLVAIVECLLQNGALPDICDELTGSTPLMFSVLQGSLDISRTLISFGASVDQSDFRCVTPLMLAAVNNDAHHCKLLCTKLADVDLQDTNGWTALHYCAMNNSTKALSYLLQEGASKYIKDANKRKALDIAKFKQHGNCVAIISEWKGKL
eukprot:gene11802-15792_t